MQLRMERSSMVRLIPQLVLVNNKLALAYFQPGEDKSSFSFYLALVDEEDLSLKNPQKLCTIQQDNVGITKAENVINREPGFIYLFSG